MKKILFALIIVLFSSCQKNKIQRDAILKYEQTIENTFVDLSMKIIKLEKLNSITGNDSLNILLAGYTGSDYRNIDSVRWLISVLEEQLPEMKKLDEESAGSMYESNLFDKYYKNYQFALKIERCMENKDKILANVWECKYSIKNPFLGGAKQEITKLYHFSDENSLLGRAE